MIMVVCVCAMPCHVCSSCHVHSCALAPKNNVVLSSYQFRHCALCAAYVFAFVWVCFGFHGSYCSGERRKASCWDFPYMYVLVPIATKTVMWLFNRNHNSSFNGMRVNPKPQHTLPRHTIPTLRSWVIIVISFFLVSIPLQCSLTCTLKFKCGISAHTHTTTAHNDDMKHSKNPNNYLLYSNMMCCCCFG